MAFCIYRSRGTFEAAFLVRPENCGDVGVWGWIQPQIGPQRAGNGPRRSVAIKGEVRPRCGRGLAAFDQDNAEILRARPPLSVWTRKKGWMRASLRARAGLFFGVPRFSLMRHNLTMAKKRGLRPERLNPPLKTRKGAKKRQSGGPVGVRPTPTPMPRNLGTKKPPQGALWNPEGAAGRNSITLDS